MNLIKIEDVIVEIEKTKQSQLKHTEILNKVESVLKTFEGKLITKRIATAIEKTLPDYTVYFRKEYSWYEIGIWGNDIPYGENISLNLGYKSSDIFSFETYTKNNQRYYLEESRYNTLNSVDVEELKKHIDDYNALQYRLEDIKTITKQFPYPIYGFFKF